MGLEWANLFVCPYCGGEVAETKKLVKGDKSKAYFKCFNKRCRWEGTDPGEIHGRVLY